MNIVTIPVDRRGRLHRPGTRTGRDETGYAHGSWRNWVRARVVTKLGTRTGRDETGYSEGIWPRVRTIWRISNGMSGGVVDTAAPAVFRGRVSRRSSSYRVSATVQYCEFPVFSDGFLASGTAFFLNRVIFQGTAEPGRFIMYYIVW